MPVGLNPGPQNCNRGAAKTRALARSRHGPLLRGTKRLDPGGGLGSYQTCRPGAGRPVTQAQPWLKQGLRVAGCARPGRQRGVTAGTRHLLHLVRCGPSQMPLPARAAGCEVTGL